MSQESVESEILMVQKKGLCKTSESEISSDY